MTGAAPLLATLLLHAQLGPLARSTPSPDPSTTPACAAALAVCVPARVQGLTPCVQCIAAHDANLTAAKCSAVDREGFCAKTGPPPPPPPPPPERPKDSPCVTWVQSGCSGLPASAPHVADYVPAIYSAWQWEGGGNKTHPSGRCLPCSGKPGDFNCGYLFPCFASVSGTWGHRDICISDWAECNVHQPSGNSSLECDMWLPKKGPQWEHFGWQVSQQGASPAQGIGQLVTDPTGEYVLARSPAAIPFAGCGPGVTGWVKLTQEKLGCFEYDANVIAAEICNGFEVAYCKQCLPCPTPYNSSFDPGAGCPACPKPKPPPPPPPPPPPAPPGGTPCIRFGNAVASENAVDATITQGSTTYTWSNYRFSSFSDWVSIFHGGSGVITIKEHGSSTPLLTTKIPLTPGPLVVVIKDKWPPTKPTNVETIAASFPVPTNGSAVRLFNLAVDVPSASLTVGGTPLAHGVQYSLGSKWVPVPATQQTFAASGSAAPLASAPFTPPNAPEVFTTFLLGSKAFGYSLLPQVDAPETGPCKPLARVAPAAPAEQ